MGHDVAVAVVVGAGGIQEGVPQILMVQGVLKAAQGADVCQQAANGDAHHQQGLVLLLDAKIEQDAGDDDHDQVTPAVANEQLSKTGLNDQFGQRI